MRKYTDLILRYFVILLLFSTLLYAQDYAFYRAIMNGYTDYGEISTPTNPPVNFQRWYVDSTTHIFKCLRSDGSDCTPVVAVAGAVVLSTTICPVGFDEYTALDGMIPLGTIAAHMNVGTTGGSNNITPAGTNSTAAFTPAGSSAAPTVASLTAAAQVIRGSTAAEAAHTHSVTAAGTNGTVTGPAQVVSWPAGVPTNASGAFAEGAISWPAGVPTAATENAHTHSVTAAGTNGTVTGPAQVISWPAGVPTVTIAWPVAPTNVPTTAALTTGADSSTTGGVAKAIAQTPTIAWPAKVPTGVNAWPAGVPTNATSTIPAETFTGSAVTSGAGSAHTHVLSWPAGVPTIAAGVFTQPTISWPAGVPTNATSTIPAETFTGSAVTSGAGSSHLHGVGTLANDTSAVTGTLAAGAWTGTAGTVPAQVFSGTSFDNRSAFVRVIYCVKT